MGIAHILRGRRPDPVSRHNGIHQDANEYFPEIDIPVVTVIWTYTGLSTPEMEQRVTTYS
jgi:hypothetical protein